MGKYSYRAINQKGRPVRGVISAVNETDLAQQLGTTGYELIDCKEVSASGGKLAALMAKSVKTRDLIQLFVHLEQLQRAGVPLLDGLADVRDTTESTKLRDVMTEVHRDVSEGNSLSQAMANHPNLFEQIFVSLVAAGEETGNLTNSFQQLIRHLKWTDAMNVKVKKATRYPKILIVVVFGVIWLMMGQVVPQVVEFLHNIDQELPGVTLALIATSEFFSNYFVYVIAALIALYLFFRIGRSVSESFQYHTDNLALHVPVMGSLIRKIALSRFCQTFGVLFNSGLEILKCLDAARATAGNLVLAEALANIRDKVQEGSPLSVSMNNSGEFPSLVVRMVKIGEESGNLTEVLQQVADFYDRDVNEAVDAMIAMIEPALTVILGGMILWIAAGVFGPVYNSFGKMGV